MILTTSDDLAERNSLGADISAAYIHDVKNSLNLLMSKADAGHDAESMRLLMEADDKLNHLLLMYKMQGGMLCINTDAVDPHSFLDILAASYQPFTKHPLRMINEDSSTDFYFDRGLIELCLGNAIHNADRFALSEICLSFRIENGMTVIAVSDDGPGYPDHILATFGNGALTSNDGTGLGLFLSSRIAHLQVNKQTHGFVQIYNKCGAVFEMHLP